MMSTAWCGGFDVPASVAASHTSELIHTHACCKTVRASDPEHYACNAEEGCRYGFEHRRSPRGDDYRQERQGGGHARGALSPQKGASALADRIAPARGPRRAPRRSIR